MKDKKHKIPRLQADLVKYCKQIGIVEPPYMHFDPKDFDALCDHAKRRSNKVWGRCCWVCGRILVNLRPHRTLRAVIHTLIHELVHYRWHSLKHGKRFEKRIIEIRRGQKFEQKKAPEPAQ